ALCFRGGAGGGPGALAERGTDPGSAGGQRGAPVEVVPAQPHGGEPDRGGLPAFGCGGRGCLGWLCARVGTASRRRRGGGQGEERGGAGTVRRAGDAAAVVCREHQRDAAGLGYRPGGSSAHLTGGDRLVSGPRLRVVL